MPRRYHCPVEVALDVVGGKWRTVILAHLKERPHRYGELRRLMPGTSEKMLAQRLRELEAAGLASRHADGGKPPSVEYRLTEQGAAWRRCSRRSTTGKRRGRSGQTMAPGR